MNTAPKDETKLNAIVLDASDVTVEPVIPSRCDECYDADVTHGVWLDLRGNGVKHRVAEGCEVCMNDFAMHLRASLPPIPPPPSFYHGTFNHTPRCNAGGCHD